MVRPRRQESRRREFVSIVAELLIANGAEGARLTDVARAAGVTPATVIYYYPSMFDLYADAFAVVTRRFVFERRTSVQALADPVGKLIECVRLGVPTPGTSSHHAAVLLGELVSLTNRHVEMRRSALQFETEQLQLFAEILTEGVSAGRFTPVCPVSDAARLLLAGEDGLATAVIADRLTADESTRLLLKNAAMITACPLLDGSTK